MSLDYAAFSQITSLCIVVIMDSIFTFVEAFSQDRDDYVNIAREVEKTCKENLRISGTQFLWQFRVKSVDSLIQKLRDCEYRYGSVADNVADIKDLVGGRLVLARWTDREHVEEMLKTNFEIINRAQHPKPRLEVTSQARFRGYDALHFYIRRRPSSESRHNKLVIEIQVMTSFMWNFSSLEHDIKYKKLHGEPSKSLELVLEAFNGIASQGEVALEQYEMQVLSEKPAFSQRNPLLDEAAMMRKLAAEIARRVAGQVESQQLAENIISWISPHNFRVDHDQVRDTLGRPYKDSGQWLPLIYNKWIACLTKPAFWLVRSGLLIAPHEYEIHALMIICVSEVGTGKSSLT